MKKHLLHIASLRFSGEKLLLLFLLSTFTGICQKQDTSKHNTIHIKKVKHDTMPDRPLFWGGANVPPPIRLTICGKDSGEIDKPALGKCQKISIGGWENSNRDIVFSFDLCIKHKGVYLTKHTNSTVLTDEMKVMLKQVSAGDSVIVKNVKYKERYKGIVTLPAISLLVVNKETAIKKTATDSLKIKQ